MQSLQLNNFNHANISLLLNPSGKNYSQQFNETNLAA
jgi:hypothetical protein